MVAMTREKLGLKLLRALKREKDSGKSLLDCRPVSAVAIELKFTDSQFKIARGFLIEKQASTPLLVRMEWRLFLLRQATFYSPQSKKKPRGRLIAA